MASGNIVPVNASTFTDCMELLQEAYVSAVAATAGCSVQFMHHDTFKKDALFVRPGDVGKQEVSFYAQLKSTTTIKPAAADGGFSYQFKKRAYMEDLALADRSIKVILIVMATHPSQSDWSLADHDDLRLRHCCYWKSLEGETVPPGVQTPSTRLMTANIFDAVALTGIMDRIDRGEAL